MLKTGPLQALRQALSESCAKGGHVIPLSTLSDPPLPPGFPSTRYSPVDVAFFPESPFLPTPKVDQEVNSNLKKPTYPPSNGRLGPNKRPESALLTSTMPPGTIELQKKKTVGKKTQERKQRQKNQQQQTDTMATSHPTLWQGSVRAPRFGLLPGLACAWLC